MTTTIGYVSNNLGSFRVTVANGYCIKMLHLTMFTEEKQRAWINTKLDRFGVTATIGYVTNKLGCFRFTATIVYCFKMLHLTLFTNEKRRALANPKLGSFIGLKLVMLIKY